jgi:hypothetical protein
MGGSERRPAGAGRTSPSGVPGWAGVRSALLLSPNFWPGRRARQLFGFNPLIMLTRGPSRLSYGEAGRRPVPAGFVHVFQRADQSDRWCHLSCVCVRSGSTKAVRHLGHLASCHTPGTPPARSGSPSGFSPVTTSSTNQRRRRHAPCHGKHAIYR